MKKECRMIHKQYSRYGETEDCIARKRDAVRAFRELAESISSANKKVEEYENEIEELERRKVQILGDMLADFELLDSIKYYTILKGRYIDGLTWRDVAKDVGYEEKYVIKLRNKALAEIVEKKKTLNDTK